MEDALVQFSQPKMTMKEQLEAIKEAYIKAQERKAARKGLGGKPKNLNNDYVDGCPSFIVEGVQINGCHTMKSATKKYKLLKANNIV